MQIEKEKFIEICRNSNSMLEAAGKIGLNIHKFIVTAKSYGCYKPNQAGRGIKKPQSTRYLTEDILNGKYPHYKTGHLKIRLLEEGYKDNKCEVCGISKWNGKKLINQLHHKDGNNRNHSLDNLQMICPNCHSQTESFCGKNKNVL